MTCIPEDFTRFLYWIKEHTEAHWAQLLTDDPQHWAAGATWTGMTEEQVAATEAKYQVQFTPGHRAFLLVLHTPDRKQINTYENSDGTVDTWETSFFHNWLQDDAALKNTFEWPLKNIFLDIQGRYNPWYKIWGENPGSEAARKAFVTQWLEKAPPLIPVTDHRFLVSDRTLPVQPLLSIWGNDVVVIGHDLKSYLLDQFAYCLPGMLEYKYLEEDNCFDYVATEALLAFRAANYELVKNEQIPCWQDIILSSPGSWLWTNPV